MTVARCQLCCLWVWMQNYFHWIALQYRFCFRSIIHLTCLSVSCLLLFTTWKVLQKLEMELLYLNWRRLMQEYGRLCSLMAQASYLQCTFKNWSCSCSFFAVIVNVLKVICDSIYISRAVAFAFLWMHCHSLAGWKWRFNHVSDIWCDCATVAIVST